MATILTKKSDTASAVPASGDLTHGSGGAELAVNTADKRIFTKNSGGTVVELGTNPSTLTVDTNTLVVDATNNSIGIGGSGGSTYKLNISSDGATTRKDISISRASTGSYPVGISLLDTGGTRGARIEGSLNTLLYKSGSDGSTNYGGTYGHVFYNGASEVARIDSSGNVGIGTSSPSSYSATTSPALTVLGSVSGANGLINAWDSTTGGAADVGGNITFGGNDGVTATRAFANIKGGKENSTSGNYASYLSFSTRANGGATTERMRIDSSGNVGIGTTSPETTFSVAGNISMRGTTDHRLTLNSQGTVGTNSSNWVRAATTNVLYNSAGGSHSWEISGTERMRIDSSGNLLVGTTSAGGSEGINLTRPANTATYIRQLKSTQAECTWGFKSSTDTNMYIGSGSSAVGTYGVYLTNTGNSWNAVSDERMKTIVEPIENAAEKVSTLRSVIGYYNHDEKQIRRPFLIAQDVQAVLPEAVNIQDEETGTLGMSYTDTIPLLVAAIKELKAENDALKSRLDAAGL